MRLNEKNVGRLAIFYVNGRCKLKMRAMEMVLFAMR